MARDAVDIKESLGVLVMHPRSVKRTFDQVELAAKEDPGNRAMHGDLKAEVARALEAADAEDPEKD